MPQAVRPAIHCEFFNPNFSPDSQSTLSVAVGYSLPISVLSEPTAEEKNMHTIR